MKFCTRCGKEMEEHWNFCHKCGALKEVDEPKQEDIIPQQEIETSLKTTIIDESVSKEKRFVKNKKVLALSISLIVVCILAGVFGILYIQMNNRYDNLTGDYNDLLDEYNDFAGDYNGLLSDYNTLLSDYNNLFGQYQSILNVLEDPLTNPVIPTISEVQSWLSGDDTDIYNHTEIWTCGDFASMLMVRAKAMNWRIRIAIMFYSFEGESGWQSETDPYGFEGHAFNLIYVQDGNDPDNELDVWYIEPQNDVVWWVNYGDDNHLHYDIWTNWAGVVSGTVWYNNPYWVNFYSYFA